MMGITKSPRQKDTDPSQDWDVVVTVGLSDSEDNQHGSYHVSQDGVPRDAVGSYSDKKPG